MTENEEFEFRARLEKEQTAPAGPQLDSKGRYVVEPNVEQRRMGLRKNRFKDENLAGNVGSALLSAGEDMGREATMLGTGMGLPPAAANVMGFAADAGTNLLPLGRVGQGAKIASEGAGAAVRGAAKLSGLGGEKTSAQWLMEQALSARSKSIVNGDSARAVDTMLETGANATSAGAAKLRLLINDLRKQVADIVSKSPMTVDRAQAYKELQTTLDDVGRKGAGYEADQNAIRKAWEEFKNHPLTGGMDQIPIQAADTIKRGSQQAAESAYGSLTPPTAGDKANMAIASGLRQGIEAAEPAVGPLNKKMSDYINALELIEPRVASWAKNQVAGLAPAAQSPEASLFMLADRNPWFKSYLAQVLHRGEIPSGIARTGTATALTTQEGR